MEQTKIIKGRGESAYDYKYDILFFKLPDRDYLKSIELDNVLLDIDKDGLIVGIRIFEASEFLNVSKSNLLKIPRWEFVARVEDGRIAVRLTLAVVVRNKVVRKSPVIIQTTNNSLPNSEIICEIK